MNLILFYKRNSEVFHEAVEDDNIMAVLFDQEFRVSANRQLMIESDFSINSSQDLEEFRKANDKYTIVRVNGGANLELDEISKAFDSGADEILIPMVRNAIELEPLFKLFPNRKFGIMLETKNAITNASILAHLPLSRVFVGLNDLALELNNRNIFLPLIDGTIENIRSLFKIPFGLGGATDPDQGDPIPSRLLLSAMIRMQTDYTFLRRSFYRDVRHQTPEVILNRIVMETAQLQDQDRYDQQKNYNLFIERVQSI